jgi:hypothetical protein
MTENQARAEMTRIDIRIQQIDVIARSRGVDPFTLDEYGDLLADWLSAAWRFYCGEKETVR